MSEQPYTDLQRAGAWLAEEVVIRVSRRMLVAGGLVLLLLAGAVLD
jgi:hypothetical protein